MARTLNKPLGWLKGEVKAPPFSAEARLEAGFLLRRLQKGILSVPKLGSKQDSCCADCRRAIVLACHIPGPCHRSARNATNCGSTTRTKLGGLSTTLLQTPW